MITHLQVLIALAQLPSADDAVFIKKKTQPPSYLINKLTNLALPPLLGAKEGAHSLAG